jgi:hypothetical protein
MEPSLLKSDLTLREDAKFELGLGYRDTLLSIYKMDDLNTEIGFAKAKLPPVPPRPVSR